MKVGDLELGMLLKSESGARLSWETVSDYHFKGYGGEQCDVLALRPGFLYTTPIHGPFMYLGFEVDKYAWEGVWKHHRVLVDGTVAHLSGYDVRYFEPVDFNDKTQGGCERDTDDSE